MAQQTVISFYKFTPLKDLESLRTELLNKTRLLGIKGTLLIASEGINGMVSGAEQAIEKLKEFLVSFSSFSDLEFKDSYYQGVTFRRMLVKVKKEIITIRQPVVPHDKTGPYIDPLELKKKLDNKEDLTLLDTRNTYEVELGTFKGAVDPRIDSFSQFTQYIDDNVEELKKKPVVTFCTGGIRCEKATAYMMEKGIKDLYQLKGGILKYFEDTMLQDSDNHWQGDCVVFDKRKAITPTLKPSEKLICYVCLKEMAEDHKHPEPGPGGDRCQSCHRDIENSRQQRIERKQNRVARSS